MGTQFTSRLNRSDRERIYKGIVKALKDQLPPAIGRKGAGGGKSPSVGAGRARKGHDAGSHANQARPGATSVKSLSPQQRQHFAQAAIREVLNVAADRGFFTSFGDSQLFPDELKWLLRLRADAEFTGFEGIIEEYQMTQSANAIGDLSRKLLEIAKGRADPFRVACTNAAKAVLAETSLQRVAPKPGEVPVRTFGRQLAALSTRELVTRYIHRFVYEVLSKSMSMSDPPAGAVSVVNEAIGEIPKATGRIAGKALEQIVKEGRLNDTHRIHEIVASGLKEYAQTKGLN